MGIMTLGNTKLLLNKRLAHKAAALREAESSSLRMSTGNKTGWVTLSHALAAAGSSVFREPRGVGRVLGFPGAWILLPPGSPAVTVLRIDT